MACFLRYNCQNPHIGMSGMSYYFSGVICFKDEESLLKSLEEHKEQWEIVRKYEMGEM